MRPPRRGHGSLLPDQVEQLSRALGRYAAPLEAQHHRGNPVRARADVAQCAKCMGHFGLVQVVAQCRRGIGVLLPHSASQRSQISMHLQCEAGAGCLQAFCHGLQGARTLTA